MFYRFARGLFRLILRVRFRWRVLGLENVPREGPVILAANHASWWDPPIVGCSVDRQVHFMAKEEWFNTPVLGKAIAWLGAIPVKRHSADLGSLKRSLKVLSEGRVFGIFPEGTRSRTGQMLKPEPGVAWVALKGRASVVPVAIMSSFRWFAPLTVKIGKPLDLSSYYDLRMDGPGLERISQEIMDAIAALMGNSPAYPGGAPAGKVIEGSKGGDNPS